MSVRRWMRRGGRRGLTVLATLAFIAVVMVTLGGRVLFASPIDSAQDQPTQQTPRQAPSPTPEALQLEKSEPSSLIISSIGVKDPLLSLGKQSGKDLVELPSPASKPGWFKESVTPGEVGVSSVVGYIRKSEKEAGVFAKLAQLKTKDEISVKRKDGSTATFRVDKIKKYAEGEMSAAEVYAETDRSELRLITCGGVLKAGDKPGNVVVFAHLVSTKD